MKIYIICNNSLYYKGW